MIREASILVSKCLCLLPAIKQSIPCIIKVFHSLCFVFLCFFLCKVKKILAQRQPCFKANSTLCLVPWDRKGHSLPCWVTHTHAHEDQLSVYVISFEALHEFLLNAYSDEEEESIDPSSILQWHIKWEIAARCEEEKKTFLQTWARACILPAQRGGGE